MATGTATQTLCDLVLLSWNHLELTRPCVESILAHTTVPSRLIIVDQASDQAARACLRGLASTPTVQVELLLNPANVGYPKGMNLGLVRAGAPYVCFLNNDILVPPGWLEEMIRVAESDPSIGTVCPASNTFDVHPSPGSDWLALARERAARRGAWTEVPYGEGFCLLAKRQMMREIGGFDETTYEQIYFEDADLGRRVQARGLRCVMAEGTYVWHHGGKTMAHHPDRERLFRENERRFLAKWGERGGRVLYLMARPTPESTRRLAERARAAANRSAEVWVLVRRNPAAGALPRHLNIRVTQVSGWAFPWAALGRVFFKKKRVDRIDADAGWLRVLLRALRFAHRAKVQAL